MLPSVETGVNIKAPFASPLGSQKSGVGVVNIDPCFSTTKFKIEPRGTSKSMCDMSNTETSRFCQSQEVIWNCLISAIVRYLILCDLWN